MIEPRQFKDEFLYLTTVGRKSGKLHEIEIWYIQYGQCYYLISELRDKAHWVKNIYANNNISFWVQGTTYKGIGRAIDSVMELELAQTIAELMRAKYQWSDGLVVELCPQLIA